MRARVLVSVAVAATIAFGATGCEFMSPASTGEIRQITDGVNVTTGSLDVRNALLIADDSDGARFVGTLVNRSDKELTVSIEVGGDTQTTSVPANTHVDLAGSAEPSEQATASTEEGTTTQGTKAGTSQQVVFTDADTRPGSLVKVYFSYSGAEGVSASVPVLTSAMGEYSTLAPTATPTSSSDDGSTSTDFPTDIATSGSGSNG